MQQNERDKHIVAKRRFVTKPGAERVILKRYFSGAVFVAPCFKYAALLRA
jgi:hypothetical protein